ncbi:hypothetical protein B0T16DRAFT_421547 [Cercophora newfieldiana]|uniref:MARVEL domain-containing protein n=1 Tax=Cercophora newfieldiana TaxID=92897 RepID=A0AA40CHJ1_9PEZI|nr:hypothetical protein B0T16DRAFT_421547 [Cercophora newfieldiana]
MGARTGSALHALKLFLRTIQLLCAAVILALFSYFLATLSNHSLPISQDIRAVEGISGSAVLYSALCIITLCCFARTVHPFTSLVSMVLDVAFCAAFIYVASVNKGGTASCDSGFVNTPFGSGDVATGVVEGGGGWTALPSLATACRMQTACLAVAVVGIFFFLFSVLAEWALIRHHRKEKRYGPSPANDYTDGYGKKKGFWASLFGQKTKAPVDEYNPNALPQHAAPDDVRESYATEQTRVGSANGMDGVPKYDSLGYGGHDISGRGNTAVPGREGFDDVPLAQYPPANYRYSDGVYERV